MKKPVIIDARYANIAEKAWGGEYDIIASAKCDGVSEAISCHPDVALVKVDKKLICAPSVYDYYKKMLSPYGIALHKGSTNPGCNYPADCAYNIAITKNYALFKKEAIDRKAAEEIKKAFLTEVYVNQGYAKCSCVTLPDGIITADEGIIYACRKNSIDCLKILPGEVKLSPYDYGFLGGASGLCENKVFFFGDITRHVDFLKIKEFLIKKKLKIKYIKNYPLTDIGTIFFPY